MTRNKHYLEDICPCPGGFVTFGYGGRGQFKGIGKLRCSKYPNLDQVLYVKGLTSNLINIIQLCDQGVKTIFNKLECLVINAENSVKMRGQRSKDDRYLWKPREEFQVCEACEFMSALRKENQIISIIGKHCPDPYKEHQNMHAEKGAGSQVLRESR